MKNNMVYWIDLDYDGCYMDFGKGKKKKGLKEIVKGIWWEEVGKECKGRLYVEEGSYLYYGLKSMVERDIEVVVLDMGVIYNLVGIWDNKSESYEEYLKRKKSYIEYKEDKIKDFVNFVNINLR